MSHKKVAVMQPYWYPYIGYFQLMNAVDEFVIYNDVNYIERGWVNRNNFLINRESKLLTLPLVKATSSKLFNEVIVSADQKQLNKIRSTIKQSYSKAPYFKDVYKLFNESLEFAEGLTVDQLCLKSFILIKDYLGLNTKFTLSSDIEYERDKDSVVKLIQIGNYLRTDEMLFPSGSRELYEDVCFPDFRTYSVVPMNIEYKQNLKSFIPGLSFLDVLMFNSISSIQSLLTKFELRNLSDE